MKILIQLTAFLLLAAPSPSPAVVPRSITAQLKEAEPRDTWKSVNALPDGLKLALKQTFQQPKLHLAGIGERWAGNVVEISEGGKLPPDRRLIFAFEAGDFYVVYLEYPPPAVHTAALIFNRIKRSAPTPAWGGVEMRPGKAARTPKEVIRLIISGRLNDERGLVW